MTLSFLNRAPLNLWTPFFIVSGRMQFIEAESTQMVRYGGSINRHHAV